jgi:hypothetical protein
LTIPRYRTGIPSKHKGGPETKRKILITSIPHYFSARSLKVIQGKRECINIWKSSETPGEWTSEAGGFHSGKEIQGSYFFFLKSLILNIRILH